MAKPKDYLDLRKEFKTVDSRNGYLTDMLKKFKLDNVQDRILLAIDRAYEDGFTDGVEEAQRENKK